MVTYPKDWKECRLNEVSMINPPSEVPSKFKYVDLESVKGVSLLNTRIENKATAPSRAQRHATVGDIFFQTVRPYQRNNYFFDHIDDEYVFSTGYAQIRTDYDSKFLFYVLQKDSFVEEVINNCTGASYPAINPKKLGSIKICIPLDIAEQKAIAATLSSFDTHIDNLTALIEKKKAIRDGALADLMSGRTRLAGFSGAWELRRIRDIGNIITGSTPPRGNSYLWNGDFCWVTARDLKGKYVSTTFEKITSVGKEYCRTVPKGSVLVTCIASIGLNGIATVSLATNQQINSVICYDEYHSEFVYYCIEYNRPRLEQMAGQTAVPIVSKKQFGGLEVDIPANLDEQKAIADILASMDTEIQNLEAERDKIQAMREGAMDDLLTGRVRLPL